MATTQGEARILRARTGERGNMEFVLYGNGGGTRSIQVRLEPGDTRDVRFGTVSAGHEVGQRCKISGDTISFGLVAVPGERHLVAVS